MKLTNITLENMRGQTRELALAGLDLLIAANGRGKSTTLDAVELALAGRIYRLGLKTEFLLPLFRDGTMAVGLTGVNGGVEPVRVARGFRRKSNGALEQSLEVSPAGGARKIADMEVEVRRHFGACTVALDLNELLSLTANEQKKLLFGFADLGAIGMDRAGLFARICRRVVTDDVQVKADRLEAAEKWLQQLTGWWGATSDVDEGLGRLAKSSEEALRTWKKNLSDAEASMREMSDQAAQQTPAREAPAVEDELRCARAEATQLEREDAADSERRRAILDRQRRIAECRTEIGRLSTPGANEEASKAAADLELRRAELSQIAPVTQETLEDARVAAEKARSGLKTATDTIARIDRDIAKIERRAEAVERHECPTCTCDVELVRADILQERKPLQEECAEIGKGLDRLRREELDATRRVEDLRQRQKKRAEIEGAIGVAQQLVDGWRATAQRRADALALARRTLLKLQEEDAAAPAVADSEALGARLRSAQARVARLEAEQKAAQAARERHGVRLEAAKRKAQAELNVQTLTAVKAAVGPAGVQGEVVAALAGPLTTAANALLDLVGEFRLGVRLEDERGNPGFVLGWDRADGFVTWENLSGGQRAIFGVALAAAMLELQRPPLRLLKVDGLEALDNRNKLRLLGALGKLYEAGRIDNAIVAGVATSPTPPAGPAWTVHRLNGSATDGAEEASK